VLSAAFVGRVHLRRPCHGSSKAVRATARRTTWMNPSAICNQSNTDMMVLCDYHRERRVRRQQVLLAGAATIVAMVGKKKLRQRHGQYQWDGQSKENRR
jgi:hypothetical protein